jgi:hypothetical protein
MIFLLWQMGVRLEFILRVVAVSRQNERKAQTLRVCKTFPPCGCLPTTLLTKYFRQFLRKISKAVLSTYGGLVKKLKSKI